MLTGTTTEFKLGQAVSPTKKRVMTTLPRAKFIKKIKKLDEDVSKKLITCLSMIYSHVVQRDAAGQDEAHFFISVPATSMFESHYQILIKGKDHGLKAGGIFNQIKNVLAIVEKKLKTELLDEHRNTLEICQASLMAYHNAFVAALDALPEDKKQKLENHQNISSPTELVMTPQKLQRLKMAHPRSPNVDTPKKLSKRDLRAIAQLQGETSPAAVVAPPTPKKKLTFPEFPTDPAPAESNLSSLMVIPRTLLLKRRASQKAANKTTTTDAFKAPFGASPQKPTGI